MAIVQENRFDAPVPEVSETDYGAKYVTAATETPVAEAPAAMESSEEPAEAPAVERKKGGRPRKGEKKK